MIDIRQLQQRTQRYEFADGVREVHNALWLLIMGFYAWLVWDLGPLWAEPFVGFLRAQGTLFTLIVTFGLAIGIPLLITQIALHLMQEYVRRRWLWRTTGVVRPKAWLVPRSALFAAMVINLIVFLIGAAIAVQVGDPWLIIRALYVGVGLGTAYLCWGIARRLDLPRYRVVALVGAVGTLIIALLPLTVGLSCLAVSGFWALLLTSSGVYAMHQTAAQQRAVPDEA